jgi:hypothetical protein
VALASAAAAQAVAAGLFPVALLGRGGLFGHEALFGAAEMRLHRSTAITLTDTAVVYTIDPRTIMLNTTHLAPSIADDLHFAAECIQQQREQQARSFERRERFRRNAHRLRLSDMPAEPPAARTAQEEWISSLVDNAASRNAVRVPSLRMRSACGKLMEHNSAHMEGIRQDCNGTVPTLHTVEIKEHAHRPQGSPSAADVRQMFSREVRAGSTRVLLKDDMYFPHGDLSNWHPELLARSMTLADVFIDWPKWQQVLTRPAVGWLQARYAPDSAGHRPPKGKKPAGSGKRMSVLHLPDLPHAPVIDPRLCLARSSASPLSQPMLTSGGAAAPAGAGVHFSHRHEPRPIPTEPTDRFAAIANSVRARDELHEDEAAPSSSELQVRATAIKLASGHAYCADVPYNAGYGRMAYSAHVVLWLLVCRPRSSPMRACGSGLPRRGSLARAPDRRSALNLPKRRPLCTSLARQIAQTLYASAVQP